MRRFPAEARPGRILLLGVWMLAGSLAADAAVPEGPWTATPGHPSWLALAETLKRQAQTIPDVVPPLEGPLLWKNPDPVRAERIAGERKRLSSLAETLRRLRERVLALPVPETGDPRADRVPFVEAAGRPLCTADGALLRRRWRAIDFAAPYRSRGAEDPLERAARLRGWRELAGRYLRAIAGASPVPRKRKSASPESGRPSVTRVADRLRELIDRADGLLRFRNATSPLRLPGTAGDGERLLARLRGETYDRLLAPFAERIALLQTGLDAETGEAPTAGRIAPEAEVAEGGTGGACRLFEGYRKRLQRLLDGPHLLGSGRDIAGFYMDFLLPLDGLCGWMQVERLPNREGMEVGAAAEAWSRWHRRSWIRLYLRERGWILVDPLGIEENLRLLEAAVRRRPLQVEMARRLAGAEPLSAVALAAWDRMLASRMAALLEELGERTAWYARLAMFSETGRVSVAELRDRLAGKLAVLLRYVAARDDLRIFLTTRPEELLKRKLDRLPGGGVVLGGRLVEDGGDAAEEAMDRAVAMTLAALRRSGVDLASYLSPKHPAAGPLGVMLGDLGEEALFGVSDWLALARHFGGGPGREGSGRELVCGG